MKYNTPLIKETSRLLRRRVTPSELRLWQIIRNRKFLGVKFFRQYPIRFEMDGQKRFFIADFCSFEQKLIIEIDGLIHERQKDYDALRTFIIECLGMRVIRFRNDDILENLEGVLDEMKKQLTP